MNAERNNEQTKILLSKKVYFCRRKVVKDFCKILRGKQV